MTPAMLKEYLHDWTDSDVASYRLAHCLGIMSADVDFPIRAKGVFWSNNPIGNMLTAMLNNLAENGVLEYRDEPDYQYRWDPNFKGYWE